MKDDSVLREAYAIKDELARRYGNDVRKLGEAIRKQQEEPGRKVVSPPGKQRSR